MNKYLNKIYYEFLAWKIYFILKKKWKNNF